MKQHLIIGAIGDYQYSQISPWINSLNRSGFQGKKILLSYNSKPDLIKQISDNGVEVYAMEHDSFGNPVTQFVCHSGYANKGTTSKLVHHIRFWHIYQLLKEIGTKDLGWCVHTDVRDVVFQQNPSEWLYNFEYSTDARCINEGKTIVAPSEYLTFDEESWNGELGKTNYGPYVFKHVLKDSLVYNVGSFAAEADDFMNLCLFTYLLCHRRDKLADQPTQALLFSTLLKDKVYTAETKDAWALQCATLIEQNHKYKDLLRGKLPTIRDDQMIVNENNVPYTILHQYDRIPEFQRIIEGKYGI